MPARPATSDWIAMAILGIDHLVLTVRDLEASCAFYRRVLELEVVTFGDGRTALQCGAQKINLHVAGAEIEPHAEHPAPGSADLCLLTDTPPEPLLQHLRDQAVEVILGPVPRTGARGPIVSIYFRDPDGNLIEVANYPAA
jgi:catechol 2,3-dioxygenase-like lactoylglutathione lyase family enzyme